MRYYTRNINDIGRSSVHLKIKIFHIFLGMGGTSTKIQYQYLKYSIFSYPVPLKNQNFNFYDHVVLAFKVTQK